MAQLVKNPPAIWETWVQSLDREDPLEKGKATHSSCTEEPHAQRNLAGYSPWGHKESDTTEQLTLSCSPSQSFYHSAVHPPELPTSTIHSMYVVLVPAGTYYSGYSDPAAFGGEQSLSSVMWGSTSPHART